MVLTDYDSLYAQLFQAHTLFEKPGDYTMWAISVGPLRGLFSVLWGLERAWLQVGAACLQTLAVVLPSSVSLSKSFPMHSPSPKLCEEAILISPTLHMRSSLSKRLSPRSWLVSGRTGIQAQVCLNLFLYLAQFLKVRSWDALHQASY